jgi:hypothetical protein
VVRDENRVVSLAGLFHDTTGCPIAFATRLVDRMVATSFRYGELREVVREFRRETEPQRRYLRYLNRQLFHAGSAHLFEAIYSQPYPVIERFSRGELMFLDRSRITLGRSHRQISGLARLLLPYRAYPAIPRVSKV